MLVEFEQTRMVQTTRNFELFWPKKKKTKQKTGVFKTIFDKALTPFWKTILWLKNCLMLHYCFPDYHLSVFQKLR